MGGLVWLLALAAVATVWVFHLRGVKKASASTSWPTVQGVVERSAVRENLETGADGDSDRAYYADVRYSYAVDGRSYAGERIAYGAAGRWATAAGAQKVCDRYRQGAAIAVRYDPADPAEAVLESKRPSLAAPIIATVVVLIFAFIASAIFAPAG